MKKRVIISIGILVVLGILFGSLILINQSREINASKIINIDQSNYKSITINDKNIESESKYQYLIDDFIPKLYRYTLVKDDEEVGNDFTYKVDIKSKQGSVITLLDNDYLIVDDVKYIIVDGNIDLEKFYNFIE